MILTISLGLALPATAADETSDEAPSQITQAVKETLDLDTDAYSEFQGKREDYCLGIDAVTEKPVWREVGDSAISYTDLDKS